MARPRSHRPLLAVCLIAAVLLGAAAPAQGAYRRLGDRTLRVGSHGDDVRTFQRLLTRSGFRATADGRFGQSTRTALTRFQRSARLRRTGVAGPKTIRIVRGAARSASAPPVSTGGGVTFGAPMGPAAAAPAAAPAATGPPGVATLRADGTALAPADAPPVVVAVIAAANRIATLPYRYGGGHGSFDDTAYDCSGSVSYALHGGDLLDRTLVSGDLARWGRSGAGRWITVYANAGHVYMLVAGLRFDTSGQKATGSRWQTPARSNPGFTVRHPEGL